MIARIAVDVMNLQMPIAPAETTALPITLTGSGTSLLPSSQVPWIAAMPGAATPIRDALRAALARARVAEAEADRHVSSGTGSTSSPSAAIPR
jgi:hypothetical protein